jgi:hypothetical protein
MALGLKSLVGKQYCSALLLPSGTFYSAISALELVNLNFTYITVLK